MSTIKIKQNDIFEDIPTLEGAQGVPGPQGPAGNGVPTGGNENNVLVKNSPANYDTSWKSLVDLIYPIGSYYETSDTSFNPNISFGGVWEQEEDGTVLASRQTTVGGSALGANVGSIVGEETHSLSVGELPSHTHSFQCYIISPSEGNWPGGSDKVVVYGQPQGTQTHQWGTDPTGSGWGFNLIQPTKIICRWHRIG